MNPAANSAAAKRSTSTTVSAPRSGGSSGTTRSACFGGRRRPRPSSSTMLETTNARALLMAKPLSHDHADRNEERGREEPRHKTLRHRADVADRPTAVVVRMLRPVDVADDRVELMVRDRLRRELRHDVGADADRLRDLHVRRVLERRRKRSGDDAALRDHLMTPGAVVREQVQALREIPALGMG